MTELPSRTSVLYIAYHYPPILGSSGVHRTLAFTRHLSEAGWQVKVLSTSLKAYRNWSPEQQAFIPQGVEVIRAYARDTSRHFSWRGRYLAAMALPDNWQSWIMGGVLAGLAAIAKKRPDVIVSTYPIASAHLIALVLHRLTGIPWVADLRDPMAQEEYPSDARQKRMFQWMERMIVKHGVKALVTAPGAKEFYMQKFPSVDANFWTVIPNGYDAKLFSELDAQRRGGPGEEKARHLLLHSGVIYPSERDPSEFFAALAELKAEGVVSAERLEIRLRATGHDAWIREKASGCGVEDMITLEPPIPYLEALKEMLTADGLLLLQAANCNFQIPAKAYEYIRARKPILALTPPEGDTGQLLADLDIAEIASLHHKEAIKTAIKNWLQRVETGEASALEDHDVEAYSRQHQAQLFENVLHQAVAAE